MQISVLGAGAWGTALAVHAARAQPTLLWGRDGDQIAACAQTRRNDRYLPGVALPDALTLTAALPAAIDAGSGADDLLVVATPLAGLAGICAALAARAQPVANLIWLCKGLEPETAALPHQIVEREFAGTPASQRPAFGALSGPSFAAEVGRGLPCALTIATANPGLAAIVQRAFHHHAMRVYDTMDLVGVEVGGAVKNIMAVATGASDGLGLGYNARAALVTRGLAEMTRLGVALGAQPQTFMGLTGVGDLLLTATGDLSRNRTVGLQLAQGKPLAQILDELGHVAEGVRCARAVQTLAQQCGVSMPITEMVCAVLFDDLPVADAVAALLRRDARSEG